LAELEVPELVVSFAKRGHWLYHEVTASCGTKLGAWQYGDFDWWLRQRKTADGLLRWCGYCYRPPYRWWHLHTTAPETWDISKPRAWYEFRGWPAEKGMCTHRRLLKNAMPLAEKAMTEYVLKALANI
jgi:hypothetical protein